MIEVGVPFDNPTEYVPLDKSKCGNIKLKLDCSEIGESSINYLARMMKKYLKVYIVGGNLIYAEGRIEDKHYRKLWHIIDCFNVKLID